MFLSYVGAANETYFTVLKEFKVVENPDGSYVVDGTPISKVESELCSKASDVALPGIQDGAINALRQGSTDPWRMYVNDLRTLLFWQIRWLYKRYNSNQEVTFTPIITNVQYVETPLAYPTTQQIQTALDVGKQILDRTGVTQTTSRQTTPGQTGVQQYQQSSDITKYLPYIAIGLLAFVIINNMNKQKTV